MRPPTHPVIPPWSFAERVGLVLWGEVTFAGLVTLVTGTTPSPVVAFALALVLAASVAIEPGGIGRVRRGRRADMGLRRQDAGAPAGYVPFAGDAGSEGPTLKGPG